MVVVNFSGLPLIHRGINMKLDRPLSLNFSTDEGIVDLEQGGNDSNDQDEIDRRREQVAAYEKKIKALEREKTKMSEQVRRLERQLAASGSDTDIEPFLRDIEPFFYRKRLTYVDVGAFTGEVFLKINSTKYLKLKEVHLFEPNPESFKILKDNLSTVKNLPILHAYNLGLGEESGSIPFLSAKSMTKVARKIKGHYVTADVFESSIVTLDSQVKNIADQHISLLKIDVEGYELQVLSGAIKLLERHGVDIIYIEVGLNIHGTQQTYFSDVDGFLQKLGYRAFKIYEQKNEWIGDSPCLRRCNVAYMSEKFASGNPYSVVKELFELREKTGGM